MPSTYSPRIATELQAAGENLATWGQPKLNNNFVRIDYAVKGFASFALSGSKTLTSSNTSVVPADIESVASVINITSGTGGTITVPSREGSWSVLNQSSGTVTFTTGGGISAVIASGDRGTVVCDGTNCYVEMRRDFGGQRVLNVGTPTTGTDAATKAYVDSAAFSSSLPNQSGNAGRFLSTDGTNAAWQTVFPSFGGTNGYILTSNGSSSVWSTPTATRSALGLGDSSTRNVGTTAGTVAAGDDSRLALATGAMPKSGGVFTGSVTAPVFSTQNSTTDGYVVNNYAFARIGYTEFFAPNGSPGGVRVGYLGFGDGVSNFLNAFSESGWAWRFNARPQFNGQTPYDTGNITYGTAAPGTLPVGAIYLRHA